MPTFLSPFRWRIVAQLSNGYELHDIDLLDSRYRRANHDTGVFWRLSLHYPNQWTPRVERAATTTVARTFLGFSRFPAARAFTDQQGTTTVRWNDMRFVGGVLALDQPAPRAGLFSVTVRLDPAGEILSATLGQ